MLVVMKTLPEILLSPIGGILADSFDRRKMMIALDIVASIVVLGTNLESDYIFRFS